MISPVTPVPNRGWNDPIMSGYRDNAIQDTSKRRKVPTPAGYESSQEFLSEMRTFYSDGRRADSHNEEAGRDDAKFVIGKQWDEDVERRRKAKKKPVLTFDRLQAFVAQVVNNRLMNETEIRVFPDKDGTKEIALLREGLIRSIYKNSLADFARDEALKYQVIGGQGAFCLSIDYVSDDVFEQQIRVKNVADPYAIVLDPLGVEPTGADCEWGFVGDDVPLSVCKKRWPWAAPFTDMSFSDDSVTPWISEETARIVAYWRMVTEGERTLALYTDGTTHDVSDMEEYEYLPLTALREDKTPYIRVVPKRFARMYLCSGNEILEGPYDYPFSSIPIYRVAGWEVTDGEKLYRWGLVRKLKDPLRLHNYWRSTQAEMLIATPRNKWLTTPAAVKGYEGKWRAAATSDDPFLFYVDGEEKPTHIPPPPLDPGLMSEMQQTMQDLRDISNIHEAALGAPSNEVSKVAIQARSAISDVGTFIYHDRLRMADERCAKNINEAIPTIYDTQRMEVIFGTDNKPVMALLNDPSDPNSDITAGRYGISVTVGPSTVTKRQLAAEQQMSFMNAIGPEAAKFMDLVAESQDWANSDKFVRRMRMSLPDGYIPEDELSDEEKQARQGNSQMAQMQQQLEQANATAEIAVKEAKAEGLRASAEQARANAYKAISDAQARMKDVDSKTGERRLQGAMDALDQHNALESEDRDFESQQQAPEKSNGDK